MKKITTIFILLALPVFLTACTSKQNEPGKEDVKVTEGGPSTVTGNLFDLTKLGLPQKCSGEFGDTKTVAYISGNKSYSEITSTSEELGEQTFYSIFDGDWFYSWGGPLKNGTKMKASDIQESVDVADPDIDKTKFKDVQQDLDYSCVPWIVDGSKFVPPSDVNFVDFGESLKEITKGLEQITPDSLCAMCELVPDPQAKEDCLANCGK
ncbi:hypothetical protein A3K34_04780 [candidate division WWE3 bacterium RIFOXYC1_FULL_40_10]|uniref:Lipoprotein n=1 Tax=candidate division WWE3 bacterium RIFOXYA2_FULL_46_9 TaxID=1802636 RepID=A0A1F4W180_UNCKA|nr:MAG: hypothetical protein A3K58_04780 [candidate division WWE3 bacterium RIFOXYB1_FULL_40_22]OGC62153.1 MAG: hypothetical protein A3K37_04780 [candidate division WWE3 bacterium RIFOXYA1_FULL_40_11]OGC63166.1 MAG: hypothetical protein A2264_00525 [candidate division WWE3 bacterium RIFOXYA2_FULL_46_9]OGC65246.1 MAG: hypothetical protein A2326_04160 [candidate division WWE3 bacterium RIFOXYB2_FULL_41_6]OGC66536.1 MAG: hypothetical protein A3K34_04780 [candidate division WWE3 bacterium RIFOXYC1_